MTASLELTGQRFVRLLVLRRVENNCRGNACWRCLCDCGNITIVVATRLKKGLTKSCGCLQREAASVIGKEVGPRNIRKFLDEHPEHILTVGFKTRFDSSYGKERGRKNVESGQIQKLGKEQGRKNVKSGHLDRIRSLIDPIKLVERASKLGRDNVKSGQLDRIRNLPQSKEAQRRLGQERGREAVESGRLAKIAILGTQKLIESGHMEWLNQLPQTLETQRNNGRKAVESGQIYRAPYGTPIVAGDGIRFGSLDEATTFELALELGGKPRHDIRKTLSDSSNYYFDLLLVCSVPELGLEAGIFYELKPAGKGYKGAFWRSESQLRRFKLAEKELGARVVLYSDLY